MARKHLNKLSTSFRHKAHVRSCEICSSVFREEAVWIFYEFIPVHSPGARAENIPISTEAKHFYVFNHLLYVSAIFKTYWEKKINILPIQMYGGAIFFLSYKDQRSTFDHHLNKFCRSWVPYAIYQDSASKPSWFWRRRFLSVFFLPYMGNVAIVFNSADPFEQVVNILSTEGPMWNLAVSEKTFKNYTMLYMYIAQGQGQTNPRGQILIVIKTFY